MKSEAKNVTQYLEGVPPNRLKALINLRGLCSAILSGYEESMEYKMPCYKLNDGVEVAFASQKQHICVYFLVHQVMLNNKNLLVGLNHGKGCIRYSNPNKIDFSIIETLLKATLGL